MYFSFVSSGKPMLGDKSLAPIRNGELLMSNEIISSTKLEFKVINSTFGNSDFWDELQ
jgi:hypothetical protein